MDALYTLYKNLLWDVHIAQQQRNTKTISKCEEGFNAATWNTWLNKRSHMATCAKRTYLGTKFHLWWESTQNRSSAPALIWNPAVFGETGRSCQMFASVTPTAISKGSLTLIYFNIEQQLHWSENQLPLWIITKTRDTQGSCPFRPHWDLPCELLAALAGWQISRPLLLVTNTVVAGGISPALMKLHGICSALHKPFPKEAMINPLSLSDLTAVLRDV